MTTKIYDNKNKENKPSETPPTTQQRIDSGQMPQYAENGLFHSPIAVQNIHYKVAPNEEVLKNEGSYIVLGTDRPDAVASGLWSDGL